MKPFPFQPPSDDVTKTPLECLMTAQTLALGAAAEQTVSQIDIAFAYAAAADTYISSSNNADTCTVYLQGFKAGVYYEQEIILTGQASIKLTSQYDVIVYAKVILGTHAGDIYIYHGTATLGVPDVLTKQLAAIPIGIDVSMHGIFVVEKNCQAKLTFVEVSVDTGSDAVVTLYAKKGSEPKIPVFNIGLNENKLGRNIDYTFQANTILEFTAESVGGAANVRVNAKFIVNRF